MAAHARGPGGLDPAEQAHVDAFVIELGAYRLKDERRKVLFTTFEERLKEEVSHPLFGYKATYRRCIEVQGRLLANFVAGEIEEYSPFLVH